MVLLSPDVITSNMFSNKSEEENHLEIQLHTYQNYCPELKVVAEVDVHF